MISKLKKLVHGYHLISAVLVTLHFRFTMSGKRRRPLQFNRVLTVGNTLGSSIWPVKYETLAGSSETLYSEVSQVIHIVCIKLLPIPLDY